MKVIGLLGGVASGKSLVAEQFRRLGAAVLDADRIGHEVLLLPEVREAIRKHFGDKVFGANGEVDRKSLGGLFSAPPPAGPRELTFLEQLTHPEIRRRLRDHVEQMARDGVSAAVLDAPVMLKAGWDKLCDCGHLHRCARRNSAQASDVARLDGGRICRSRGRSRQFGPEKTAS